MELFLNRVWATLASGITDVATTLPLTTGHGARFGTIGAGNKVRIVFLDASGNVTEIAYMTAISGDNATITRGQDGTSGVAHIAGDRVEHRAGKSTMESFSQKTSTGTDAITETHAATSKATPVDADELSLADSAASFSLKKLTWANLVNTLKATLKTYFDTLYAALSGATFTGSVNSTGITGGVAVNDQAGSPRPHVTSYADANTTLNASLAAHYIANTDTTADNTAQLGFAAKTGASTTLFGSAVISCIFGARTNGQYPVGQLAFSTSTALNVAPTEKARLDNNGCWQIGSTAAMDTGIKCAVKGGDVRIVGAASTTRRITYFNDGGAYTLGSSGGAAIAFAQDGSSNQSISFETHHNGVSHAARLKIDIDGTFSACIPDGTTLYPAYLCRAWVNFNGTGTVAIRASGNVSSITDNGVGDYTVNFATALPDANYAVSGVVVGWTTGNFGVLSIHGTSAGATTKTTSALRIQTYNAQTGLGDFADVNVQIFR